MANKPKPKNFAPVLVVGGELVCRYDNVFIVIREVRGGGGAEFGFYCDDVTSEPG